MNGEDAARSLVGAVRRAAARVGLGVNVRTAVDGRGGVVVTLQGKEKAAR